MDVYHLPALTYNNKYTIFKGNIKLLHYAQRLIVFRLSISLQPNPLKTMNINNSYTKLLALLLLTCSHTVFAQQYYRVDHITTSLVSNGAITQHMDTNQVYYSNGRGGAAEPGNIQHFTQQPLLYDSIKNVNAQKSQEKYQQTYDANNNILSATWLGGPPYHHGSRTLYTYDANNRLISSVRQSHNNNVWINYFKDSTVYNSSGQILGIFKASWSQQNNWHINQVYDYTYTGTNLTERKRYGWDNTTQTLTLIETIRYYYNTANTLDSEHLIRQNTILSKTYYSYPTNKVVKEPYSYVSSQNTYRKSSKEILTYNTNGQLIEKETIYVDVANNVWYAGGYRYHYHYNSVSNNWDEVYTSSYDNNNSVYVNQYKTKYIHNSNNLYTHHVREQWDTQTNAWQPSAGPDSTVAYHYAAYTPNNIGNTAVASNIDVSLYPNPASSFINLNIELKEHKDITIAIYNTQGQLMMQLGEKAVKHYNKQIPTGTLPNGNYLINVRSKEGSTTKQFNINR